MSVFVDPNFEWVPSRKWPYESVSHMYADSPEELHQMAKSIGLKREWCSDHTQPDSRLLHYDLSPAKRILAVRAGAIEVTHLHKRPYQITSGKLFPLFAKACKDVFNIVPKIKNYPEWENHYRMFCRGVNAAKIFDESKVRKDK